MTNNQQLAAITAEEREELIADCKSDIDFFTWEINKFAAKKLPPTVMARMQSQLKRQQMALAALTQPASQAFKLPDEAPNALVALCKHMYESKSTGASVAHDVWQDCMEELRLDAPHTAQIEPICATGGAEWVKVPRELKAENGAKYVLAAEFFVGHTITCHECAGDGCEDCGEKGQWEETIMIDWPTIKEIWRRGINHFCPPSDSNT